jgi:hypothetical protein
LVVASWFGWELNNWSRPAGKPVGKERIAASSSHSQRQSQLHSPAREKPPASTSETTENVDPRPEIEPSEPASVDSGTEKQGETDKRSTDAKSDLAPPPEKTKPETSTPTAPPSAGSRTLYQEIIVSRRPSFVVAGLTIAQDLRYRVFSKLTISPKNSDGSFDVRQMIYETKLEKSEGLSRDAFEESLKALQSQELKYTFNRKHEIVKFVGPKDTRKNLEVGGLGGDGFLLTSVMDDDGWKELAQLTFFLPPEPLNKEPLGKSNRWEAKITHNWGSLGSWYGKTTYAYAGRQKDEHRIDYVHRMTYVPPGKGRKEAALEIASAEFKPLETGGTIYYDAKEGRVSGVTEKFHVRGVVATMLLGNVTTVGVEEQQVFAIRVLDQQPTATETGSSGSK